MNLLNYVPENWQKLLSPKEWQELHKKNEEKLTLIKNGEIAPNKPNTNASKQYKAGLKLNDLQRRVLLGLALGDGHLEKEKGGLHYKVRVEQKKEEYTNFLFALFAPWVYNPEPYSVNGKDTKCFNTISHAAFDFYGNAFYRDGIKVWPDDTLKSKIDDVTLAIWLMDDGSRKGADRMGINLNTQSFTRPENHKLKKVLEDMQIAPISVHLQNEKKKKVDGSEITVPQYRLYLNGDAEMALRRKIAKYVLPCFDYKLPPITVKKYLKGLSNADLCNLYPPSLIEKLDLFL